MHLICLSKKRGYATWQARPIKFWRLVDEPGPRSKEDAFYSILFAADKKILLLALILILLVFLIYGYE